MSTEFFEAIKKGEGQRVDEMLGADGSLASASNEQGVSAPLFALYNQQFEIADRIAAARDDLNVFEAAALGDVDRLKGLVNELPQRAVEPSSDGFCPLHLACFFGRVEAARYLIDQDVDVDRPTSNPMEIRPLHSAFANRDAQSKKRIIEILLEAGADPNTKQQGGYTALHSAALHGERDLVDLLIEHGADPSIPAADGRTAAGFAQSRQHSELAEWLQSKTVSPEID